MSLLAASGKQESAKAERPHKRASGASREGMIILLRRAAEQSAYQRERC